MGFVPIFGWVGGFGGFGGLVVWVGVWLCWWFGWVFDGFGAVSGVWGFARNVSKRKIAKCTQT